jgi:hypothetical protein
MAQVTLGKFFSRVPQKRKSDGDSKKIYEHKRKRGFIDSWSKFLMDYRILLMGME